MCLTVNGLEEKCCEEAATGCKTDSKTNPTDLPPEESTTPLKKKAKKKRKLADTAEPPGK